MPGFGHAARRQACEFEMQRIKCDLVVPNATCEPLLQEWMQRFKQVTSGALDGCTAFRQGTNSAMPTAAAHSRAQQGEQHVG
jgi:hypothetical protein